MKTRSSAWSRHYGASLQKYVRLGTASSLRPATRLGRQAAEQGWEILDVAGLHESILADLKSPGNRKEILRLAAVFFAETVAPIEQTHRNAQKANRYVERLTAALNRHTSGLATSRKHLKYRIAQRKCAEHALKNSEVRSAELMAETHRLQKHLKLLTYRILTAQEDERKKVSRTLYDEIAQTLVGIQIRLLTLQRESTTNLSRLKKEVASTQRMVGESTLHMERCTHELGSHHEP